MLNKQALSEASERINVMKGVKERLIFGGDKFSVISVDAIL